MVVWYEHLVYAISVCDALGACLTIPAVITLPLQMKKHVLIFKCSLVPKVIFLENVVNLEPPRSFLQWASIILNGSGVNLLIAAVQARAEKATRCSSLLNTLKATFNVHSKGLFLSVKPARRPRQIEVLDHVAEGCVSQNVQLDVDTVVHDINAFATNNVSSFWCARWEGAGALTKLCGFVIACVFEFFMFTIIFAQISFELQEHEYMKP